MGGGKTGLDAPDVASAVPNRLPRSAGSAPTAAGQDAVSPLSEERTRSVGWQMGNSHVHGQIPHFEGGGRHAEGEVSHRTEDNRCFSPVQNKLEVLLLC